MAIIVERGYPDAYQTLLSEFASKGYRVLWDRRVADRRVSNVPVGLERRKAQRRQDTANWNVLHFRVAVIRETGATGDAATFR